MCGDHEVWRDELARWGQCGACQEKEELAQRDDDRAEAVAWARQVLADPKAVVLDTETTDLCGEVIEIAVLTMHGEVLLESLVRPLGAISPGAHVVHGLTLEDLAASPTFGDLYESVYAALHRASTIVAYNADFDLEVLHRTCLLYHLPSLRDYSWRRWSCAMRWYAQWLGDWSNYHGDYRWYPLGGEHRAREDCRAVLERLRTMAGREADKVEY